MSDEQPNSGGTPQLPDPFSRPPVVTPPAVSPPAAAMTPFSSPVGPAAPPEVVAATQEVTVTAEAASGSPRQRSAAVVFGVVAAVVILIGAGVFAITKIRDNDSSGGAASPTEVGEGWFRALDDEDMLAAMDLLLPGERETFREPFLQTLEHLKRLEILGDGASADSIAGVDIHVEDSSVEESPTNVDDVAHIHMTASTSVTVDGDKVPLGSFLLDEVFGGERPDMDASAEEGGFDATLTVVRHDGRWYLSLMYSLAEAARGDRDIPETGIEPVGADSPEAAVTDFLGRIGDLDLEGMLQLLDPTEAEALLRYAPLFLPDAQEGLDEIPLSIEISDAGASASGSGSRRGVALESFTVTVTDEESGEAQSIGFADGCISGEVIGDEPVCQGDDQPISDSLPELLQRFDVGDPELANTLAEAVASALEDYEATGISVHEVDGRWYVSPLRSSYELFDDVLQAIDADELRDIVDAARAFAESLDVDATIADVEDKIDG